MYTQNCADKVIFGRTVSIWVYKFVRMMRQVTVCMGHYYYVRATACPVQIRAHHHIDVYADINDCTHFAEHKF